MALSDAGLEPYVTVKLFAWLRDLIGHKELRVPIEQAPDIERLLHYLCPRMGSACGLLGAGGGLGEGFILLLNGRSVQFVGGLEARLTAGDEVAVFPPVAGG